MQHMGTKNASDRENRAGSLHKWFRIAEKQNNLDPKARTTWDESHRSTDLGRLMFFCFLEMRLIRSYCEKCTKHVSCVRTSGSSIDGPKEELLWLCFAVLMLDWGSLTFVGRCVGLASFWYHFGTVEDAAIVLQTKTGMLSSDCMYQRVHTVFGLLGMVVGVFSKDD